MDLPSINAAFTDMTPMKASNPRVSITPEEIIPDGRRCRDAGATIVHLRARQADGSVTYQSKISLGSRQIQMPTSWQWIGTAAYSMAGLMSPRWATKLRFHSQCSLHCRHRGRFDLRNASRPFCACFARVVSLCLIHRGPTSLTTAILLSSV